MFCRSAFPLARARVLVLVLASLAALLGLTGCTPLQPTPEIPMPSSKGPRVPINQPAADAFASSKTGGEGTDRIRRAQRGDDPSAQDQASRFPLTTRYVYG